MQDYTAERTFKGVGGCMDTEAPFAAVRGCSTPVMCLIFQNHMTVETQYNTLKCVKNLDFDYYLTSHHSQVFPSTDHIDRLMRCIENSPEGEMASLPVPLILLMQREKYIWIPWKGNRWL